MKKVTALFLMLFVCYAFGFSQNFVEKADKFFIKGNYYLALKHYEMHKANGNTDSETLLKIARTNYILNRYADAFIFYSQVDFKEYSTEDVESYGDILLRKGDVFEAIETLALLLETDNFTEKTQYLLDCAEFQQVHLSDLVLYDAEPSNADINNLSKGIFYTSKGVMYSVAEKRTQKSQIDIMGHTFTNLMFSLEKFSEITSEPIPILSKTKSKCHYGGACLTNNEKTLYFTTTCDKKLPKKIANDLVQPQLSQVSTIYSAEFINNEWNKIKPVKLAPKGYSCLWPCINNAQDKFYFSSNMPGGYGGFDLYECEITESGLSKPVNLGPDINTGGDEITPFVYGTKLYYSSDRVIGFGGFDVVESVLENGKWSTPRVMEANINSSSDDYAYVINPNDSTLGFLISDRYGMNSNVKVFYVRRFPEKFDEQNQEDVEYVSTDFLLEQFNQNKNWKSQRTIYPEDELSTEEASNNFETTKKVEKKTVADAKTEEEVDYFRVQVFSSQQLYYTKAPLFHDLEIDVFKLKKTFFYTTGEFTDKESAQLFMKEVLTLGFDDVKIVKYDETDRYGKKASGDMEIELSPYEQAKKKRERMKKQEKSDLVDQPIVPDELKDVEIFRIRFMSSPAKMDNIMLFDEEAYENKEGDNYVYYIGLFTTENEAKSFKRKVEREGFRDAEVVKFLNGQVIE